MTRWLKVQVVVVAAAAVVVGCSQRSPAERSANASPPKRDEISESRQERAAAVEGLLRESEAQDARTRWPALAALGWLPQGALGRYDVTRLHPMLAAKGLDATLAVELIAEHGLAHDPETVAALVKLAARPRSASGDESADERLDEALAGALSVHCDVAAPQVWAQLQKGPPLRRVYVEVIGHCGGSAEQERWFAAQLEESLAAAKRGMAAGSLGSAARQGAHARLRESRALVIAAAAMDAALVAPILLRYADDPWLGGAATAALVALGADRPERLLAVIGADTTTRGLIVRAALGDAVAGPAVPERLAKADRADLAFAVRVLPEPGLVARLEQHVCSEQDGAGRLDTVEALIFAYHVNPELIARAVTTCGLTRLAKPGPAHDPQVMAEVDAHKQTLVQRLAQAALLPADELEWLPALALALAQRGELDEAIATLAYAQGAAPIAARALLGLDRPGAEPSDDVVDRAEALLGFDGRPSAEALWELREKRVPEAPLAELAALREPEHTTHGVAGGVRRTGLAGPRDPSYLASLVTALGAPTVFDGASGTRPVLEYVHQPATVDLILRFIAAGGFDPEAVHALARIMPRGDLRLINLLDHENEVVRQTAAYALGLQRAEGALAKLRLLITQGTPQDRAAARMAVVWIQTEI